MKTSLTLFVALVLIGQSFIGPGVSPAAAASAGPLLSASPGDARAPLAHATDRIIVKYAGERQTQGATLSAARMTALSAAAGVPLTYGRPMSGGAHVLQLPKRLAEAEIERIAASLSASPGVEYAVPDLILRPAFTPNDPQYAAQWHYFETYGVNLPGAWDITTGSAEVVVAVVDTGILNHADLAGRTVPGYDFVDDVLMANDGDGRDADPSDPGDWITADESAAGYFEDCWVSDSSWHGTHVAGTIGAASNNGVGVAGVNSTSKILPVRVLGKCGGYFSDIIDGTRWAVGLSVPGVPDNPHPARVVNMSLTGEGACDIAFSTFINEVRATGAAVIVAAGNSGVNASGYVPASCPGVIAIAATDRAGNRAYYSNYGSVIDLAAPGGEMAGLGDPDGVLSTLNTGTTSPGADAYAYYEGTSMATPHVAGIASLMLSVNPALTATHILNLLRSSATHFRAGSSCTTTTCGAGIVNADAAVRAALSFSLAAPASFTATAISQVAVRLDWVDTSLTESGFKIERAPGGASEWAEIGTVPTNTTTFVDASLPCGASFAYRARAYNVAGNSAYGAVAQVTTQPCLLAGAISGADSGAGISGARLAVVDAADPSRALTTTSSVSGAFALVVPERVFTVTVSKAGYRRAVYGPITVTAGVTATLNVTLEPATPAPVDVLLLIDGSSSMATRLSAVKNAASQLVDLMRPGDQIGVGVFSTTASIPFPLTHIEPVTAATLFTDSMESGAGRWVAETSWGLTTSQYHSRSHSWRYNSYNQNSSLRLANPVYISDTIAWPMLRFWQRYSLQTNLDFGYVEISTTASLTWTALLTYTGSNTTWREVALDLGAFKGQTIQVRYRLRSNPNSTYASWYVDDVFIGEGKVDPKAAAKAAISKIVAKGYTSVGAGLQAGHGELAARGIPSRPSAIVLLGDALEDTPPFAADQLAGLRLDHMPVHAVGVSPDSGQQFLWQLAYETGGDYYFAPGPADLASIYATIAGGVFSQQTLTARVGSLAAGAATTQSVWIGDDVAEALFSVDFANVSATFALAVQSPDGIALTSTTQQAGVEYAQGDGYRQMRVRAPALAAGHWQLIVTRTEPPGLLSAQTVAADESYQTRVSVQSSLAARFEVTSSVFSAGMPIDLLVWLPSDLVQPGAAVSVSAWSPSDVISSTGEVMVLLDDGLHADGQANDGVFGGRYTSPAEPGTYRFVASVDAVSADGEPVVRRMETFVFLNTEVLIMPQVFLPIVTTEQP